jgi:hypothetical protein
MRLLVATLTLGAVLLGSAGVIYYVHYDHKETKLSMKKGLRADYQRQQWKQQQIDANAERKPSDSTSIPQ